MLRWLERNKVRRRIGNDIYERIVAQARSPVFYRRMGVPDTMEGRFEMIVVHLVLMLLRLKDEGEAGQMLGQALNERLVADMDDALRQIGIGDMGVPRRVQKAAAAISERWHDYGAGLNGRTAGGDGTGAALEAAVARHVFAATTPSGNPRPDAIAAYMLACGRHLAAVPGDRLLAGDIDFPEATWPGGDRS